MSEFSHVTVLRDELVSVMNPKSGEVFIDCTLGGGGHAEAMLEQADCTVVGVDRDPNAIAAATKRLARFGKRFTAVRSEFSNLKDVFEKVGLQFVDGIYADLGVSSPQLDHAERGFSFRLGGPLDMRMDPDAPLTAADIVNTFSEEDLANVIYQYGEERKSRRIARAIVNARPIEDTLTLANVVATVVRPSPKQRIHPATRTFQALRIAVNSELNELTCLLDLAVEHLAPNGRIAIISFHSLEDRIVKQFFARESGRGVERDIYGHPLISPRLSSSPSSITPSLDDPNPRARSARMRTAVRLPCSER